MCTDYLKPELTQETQPEPNFADFIDKVKRGQSAVGKEHAVPILLGALLCRFHDQHFAVNTLQVLQSTHDSHNSTGGRPRISDQPETLVVGRAASCSSADVHAMHRICCPYWTSSSRSARHGFTIVKTPG